MKRIIITVMIPVLCAAILLAGCSSGKTDDPDKTSPASQPQPSQTATDPVGSNETTGAQSPTEEVNENGGAVTIRLNGSKAEASSGAVKLDGSNVTITDEGTYLISGTLDNGSIVVDADKDDKIVLELNGATINSDSYAPIYVRQADKVSVVLSDGSVNALSNGGSFTQLNDDHNVDAAIFSADDISFSGSGSLTISSPAGHGIVGKDDVSISGGTYEIKAGTCAIRANDSITVLDGTFTLNAGTDGLHSENKDSEGSITISGGTLNIIAADDGLHATDLLQIDGGSIDITAAEGMEATHVRINDGKITVNASDDGINASQKSSAYTPTVEINGGELTVSMGPGDTDGIDSNGDIIVTGGTVNVTGQSTFDYDGSASFTGGTIIVNGEQVDSIPNQTFGGGMPGGMPPGGGMPGGMGPRN